MGLQEKRAVKDFQENHYPSLAKEINTIAGFDLPIEVNWESLMVDDYAHMYTECFTKVYFTPLIHSFKEITADDLGKDALKETLKKIVIKNTSEYFSANSAYSFADGVLTIDHIPTTNIDYYDERATYLTQYLMKQM